MKLIDNIKLKKEIRKLKKENKKLNNYNDALLNKMIIQDKEYTIIPSEIFKKMSLEWSNSPVQATHYGKEAIHYKGKIYILEGKEI